MRNIFEGCVVDFGPNYYTDIVAEMKIMDEQNDLVALGMNFQNPSRIYRMDKSCLCIAIQKYFYRALCEAIILNQLYQEHEKIKVSSEVFRGLEVLFSPCNVFVIQSCVAGV